MGTLACSGIWTDLWHDFYLDQIYTPAKYQRIIVAEVVQFEHLEDMFHLPLSQQAYDGFIQMSKVCSNTDKTMQTEVIDKWF